jgi:quercetin dioxygenase-like cupin family protein
MNANRILLATLIVGGGLGLHFFAQAQKPEIGRTELTHRDLGDSVREVIQTRVDFPPAAAFPRHSHPGVEVAYVLEGSLEYVFDGKPPVTLKAGESLFIPTGTIHSARNVGGGNAAELATYVVEKGKPLVVQAP